MQLDLHGRPQRGCGADLVRHRKDLRRAARAADEGARAFADAAGFEPKAGRHLLLPGGAALAASCSGSVTRMKRASDPFLPGRLPQILPGGVYRFANEAPRPAACGARFRARVLPLHALPQARRTRAQARSAAKPRSRRSRAHRRSGDARARSRQHAGQRHGTGRSSKTAAGTLAAAHGATISAIVGDDLLRENFPLIHAVGRASRGAAAHRAAMGRSRSSARHAGGEGRLLRFGRSRHQARERDVADEEGHGRGGERAGARAHDHGRASSRCGCACSSRRSRTRFPAPLSARATCTGRARGSRSRSAIPTPKGRLVLADALTLADEGTPELLIDMGTLTGAARVALGPDMPPFYTDGRCARRRGREPCRGGERSALAAAAVAALRHAAGIEGGGLNNVGTGSFAGSIICALFLKRFVEVRRRGCTSTSTPGPRPPSPAGPRAANARPRAHSTHCSPRATAEPNHDARIRPAA